MRTLGFFSPNLNHLQHLLVKGLHEEVANFFGIYSLNVWPNVKHLQLKGILVNILLSLFVWLCKKKKKEKSMN